MTDTKIVLGLLAAVGALLPAIIITMLVFSLQPPYQPGGGGPGNLTPNVNVTLYAKEVASEKFGWGLTPDNVTSPGPTLTFKVGDTVSLTVVNLGKIPHSFGIVSSLGKDSQPLFNANIGTASNPIAPGGKASAIFKVDRVGMFYYLCTVPGHPELGMHGPIIITGS